MMRKGLLSVFTWLCCGFIANSQPNDVRLYMSDRIQKLGILKDSYFYRGYVIKNSDTLTCRIYLKKGKVTDDSYLFIITKNDKDSLAIYSASDIDGYSANGNVFKRFNSKRETVFIRLVKGGRMNLYEKGSTPANKEFTYYLFASSGEIYCIEPYSENILDEYRKEGNAGNTQINLMNTKTKKIDDKFRYLISIILGDCPSTVYLVSSGYFGIHDIESIIETYNQCKNIK